jgi:molybdopterin synthase sulfur carrier subunit
MMPRGKAKMNVTVKLIGNLHNILGKSKFTLEFENSVPLREVVKKMVEESPNLKRALIDPEMEDPRPSTIIIVNGKEISVLNGLETVLKEGDEVVFVPVLHGG